MQIEQTIKHTAQLEYFKAYGKPFITEIKGSNSGKTTQTWQWCPGPELSAESEEISFVLETTKYSKARITPDFCMPQLP